MKSQRQQEKSRAAAFRSLEMAKSAGDEESQGLAASILGDALDDRGEHEESIRAYTRRAFEARS